MTARVMKEINTERQLLAEPTAIAVDAWDATLTTDLDGLEEADGGSTGIFLLQHLADAVRRLLVYGIVSYQLYVLA